MPRPRKFIIPKQLYFVTTAVEDRLVFPPNGLINTILLSCLARAQELYSVIICDFLISTTHGHFMLMALNPDDIPKFMGRFKTESAHAINRLLGFKRKTIWCTGYDSPMIYKDLDKAIEKIAYIYANPAKDNLVDSINEYPGLSSWGIEEEQAINCSVVPRCKIGELSLKGNYAKALEMHERELTKNARKGALIVNPKAWMPLFNVSDPTSVRERIRNRVREMELEARTSRGTKQVIGRKALIETKICAPFTPNREGRRMYVICGDIELRKTFLTNLKALIGKAKEVYKRWKRGDYSLSFPLGLFPPGTPKVANPITLEGAFSGTL